MKILQNKTLILCIISLIVGLLLGNYWQIGLNKQNLQPKNNNSVSMNGSLELHSGGYRFINPLYECNTGENYGKEKLSDMESSIESYINQVTAGKNNVNASVYFRDLNNGPWFGINEKEDFAPSSLLKVPVMIAYFKVAEDNPDILNKKVKYVSDPNGLIKQNFPPPNPLIKGKTYTIEELIEHAVEQSDNVALGLLDQNIDPAKIDKVTEDLGITTSTNSTPDDFMDVSEYSRLFRVLYYTTYLNKDYSEKALTILSKSEFSQGITRLLPKNIVVAHKFGERKYDNMGNYQLHDCGIVYYPNRPYLLCVMTKGPDFNDLATTIQEISGKIYKEFSAKYH